MDAPELMESIPDSTGLGDRFEVVRRYQGGEGWSAAVQERESGETRFLKILDAGYEVHEASFLASLRHPRIPTVYEIGRTADGRSFLLREHLEGVPLVDDLPMQPAAVLELATQLLEVLAYVHLRGILHLDLKPANVLRCGTSAAPRYALLDFGLGRRGHGPATGGTLFFAAPERLLGLAPDARSDLFSFGALLFACLRPPPPGVIRAFQGRFPRDDFFTAAGVDSAELPAPFDTFLPRLLARQPDRRYADAREALEALIGASGRPSLELLRPDPIRLFGDVLEVAAADLVDGEDLVIEGADVQDRHVLALHLGCRVEGVVGVDEGPSACVLRRGGASRRSCRISNLSLRDARQHLEEVLGLDPEVAEQAARALAEEGASTPAQIARRLVGLVEQGRIRPDGPRWAWPDAAAGRLELEPPAALEASPDGLRRAAASGHVEAALKMYRDTALSADAATDRALRRGLVLGLLEVGEPARALPLVHDLPVLRARALVDLGRVRDAATALQGVDDLDSAVESRTREHVAACIERARGDLVAAEQRLSSLVETSDAFEHRIALGLVRAQRGDPSAREILCDVLAHAEPDVHPFLRGAALTNLAQIERGSDDSSAQAHLIEARQLMRRLGQVRHTATTELNLGVIAKDLGLYDAAREHLRQARTLYAHVDDGANAALAEANLGVVSLEVGDAAVAIRRLEGAVEHLDRLGSHGDRPLLMVLLARAHAAAGNRERALACLEEAGPLEGRIMAEADKVKRSLAGDSPKAMVGSPPTERDVVSSAVPDAVFRTFLAVNRRLATEPDLERALQFLLDAAVTLTGGRGGYLFVSRPDGLRSEVRVGQAPGDVVAFSRSLVNRALQQRRALTSEDVRSDPSLQEMSSVRNLELRSAICVPFHSAATGAEGAIYIEHPNRPNAFGDVEKERLDVLADQAAIAMDRLMHEEAVAQELEQSRRDLQAVRHELARSRPATMLGKSKPMKALRDKITKLAASDLSVLVLGETGTGKELVARALHDQSERRRANFVSENCSAIPADLMESLLFGHRKGAFTGADEDRPGLLELASGGTLFLDEIGDMPLALQAKLLRVLQEKNVRRVGDQATRTIDVRLVAATHKDLQAMVETGEFREDLYYRIAGADIRVPPLRERGDDVQLLADEFVKRLNRQHRRDVRLTDAGRTRLAAYPWPGNVRELEHVIARAFILTDGDELSGFELADVTTRAPSGGSDGGAWPVISLAEAEARTIRAALESTGGDKTAAAKVLKISRTALYQKLRRMK